MAHSGAVKCVNIGKKACRLLITGGEDHKVNLWAIGNPSSLTVSFRPLLSEILIGQLGRRESLLCLLQLKSHLLFYSFYNQNRNAFCH